MDMQSKRGKALSVVTAATLAASLGVPVLAVADEANAGTQAVDAQATGQDRANVVDEMLAGQAQQPVEGAVAMVGEKSFPTVQDAIDSADEVSIKLVDDVKENIVIPAGKVVWFDLNGHRVESAGGDTIHVEKGADLTVDDLAGGGVVDNILHQRAALSVLEGATVKLNGGTFERSQEKGTLEPNSANGNSYYTILNQGDLTLSDDVHVKLLHSDGSPAGYSSVIANGWYDGGPEGEGYNAKLSVHGGTVEGGKYLKNDSYGSMFIDGGKVINGADAAILNWNSLDVYGGFFQPSDSAGCVLFNVKDGKAEKGKAIIGNATFKAAAGAEMIHTSDDANRSDDVTVFTGSYSSEVPVKYIKNSSGMLVDEAGAAEVMPEQSAIVRSAAYVVKDGKRVYYTSVVAAEKANPGANVETYCVSNNGIKYASLSEAIDAADAGATLNLLDDVAESTTTEVSKDITIDLAGHSITGIDARAFTVKGGTLSLSGEGVVTSVKPEGGKLGESSSVIRVGDNGGDAGRDASLVIGKDVIVKAPSTYGVSVFGSKTAESVDVYGKIHATGTASAISGNGSAQYAGTTIVLHDGSEVTATGAAAIYHPQAGALTIEGATIKGLTGIELKGGEATVKIGGNTKVEATGEISHGENNNGTSSSGYAVAVVENKNYAGAAKVKIAAGDFVGDIAILTDNEVAADKKGSIEITGGTFSTNPQKYVPSDFVATPSNGKWVVSKCTAPVPPTPEQPDGEVEQRPDGSTVTTVTKPDGSQTVTTEAADGSQSVVSKDDKGNVTSAEATVSDKAASDGAATLPLDPVKPAADAEKAPAIEVDMPASATEKAPVVVTVPVDVDEPDYGIVVFAVDADGNETVLPKSGVDADGNVVFEATGDVTIKVVDAASAFPDTAGTWYGKQGVADFVSARGILTGIPQADGTLRFAGDGATTRAMFVTMLHRAESCPDAPDAGFDDAEGLWFEDAAAWGEATGVVDGYGGSVFGGEDLVTREQMAVFLMRYAEHLGLDVSKRADLAEFPDGAETSTWASQAMSWAVAEGLFSGRDGQLDPTEGATRAEASAVVMRFINGLYA